MVETVGTLSLSPHPHGLRTGVSWEHTVQHVGPGRAPVDVSTQEPLSENGFVAEAVTRLNPGTE